jgi:hypothetical protein
MTIFNNLLQINNLHDALLKFIITMIMIDGIITLVAIIAVIAITIILFMTAMKTITITNAFIIMVSILAIGRYTLHFLKYL